VAVGFAIIVGGWITAAGLAAVLPWFFLQYFPRKERTESARLEEIYRRDFRLYHANVPALLPSLGPWHPEPGQLETCDSTRRWSGRYYSDNNELGTLLALIAGLCFFALRTAATT
jgi:hypothetical protein